MRHVSFWSYVWDCIVHWFFIFCVKHMHWFSQKLVCLKRKKCLFREGCTADCCFLCNVIHHLCCCIPWLMIMLFSWSTNLWYNYQYCWTCVQEELYLPVAINLNFFPLLLIIYPQSFLSMNSSAVVHPHRWELTLFAMEKNSQKQPSRTTWPFRCRSGRPAPLPLLPFPSWYRPRWLNLVGRSAWRLLLGILFHCKQC